MDYKYLSFKFVTLYYKYQTSMNLSLLKWVA